MFYLWNIWFRKNWNEKAKNIQSNQKYWTIVNVPKSHKVLQNSGGHLCWRVKYFEHISQPHVRSHDPRNIKQMKPRGGVKYCHQTDFVPKPIGLAVLSAVTILFECICIKNKQLTVALGLGRSRADVEIHLFYLFYIKYMHHMHAYIRVCTSK